MVNNGHAAAAVSAGESQASANGVGPAYSKPLGSFKVKYKKSWTFKSAPLGRCLDFTVSGNITYKVVLQGSGAYSSYVWENQKLNSPKVAATVHLYRGGRCGSSRELTELDLGQHWTGYGCSFNPSLSVSFPWGVAVGGWPSCGDRNQAEYDTEYNVKSSTYTQNNSGSPTAFGDYYDPEDVYPGPCYGVFVSAVAYIGAKSDSYGASNIAHAGEVCLNKT
jgi:hypothetical protein